MKECPLARFTVYWCEGMHGIHIDGSSGEWNGGRLQPVEVVPARVFDALEREARADKALIAKLTDLCPDCPPDVAEVGCETCDGSGVVPKSPSRTRTGH